MEKVDLNGDGIELPVFIWDLTAVPPLKQGFHFSFDDPHGSENEHLVGPYPTREAALEAASKVAHEAIRAQATEDLLSFTRDTTSP